MVPNKEFYLDIDTEKVAGMGILPEDKLDLQINRMHWIMKGNVLEQKDLMILDLITPHNWERPIYFNNTSRQGLIFNFEKYYTT